MLSVLPQGFFTSPPPLIQGFNLHTGLNTGFLIAVSVSAWNGFSFSVENSKKREMTRFQFQRGKLALIHTFLWKTLLPKRQKEI